MSQSQIVSSNLSDTMRPPPTTKVPKSYKVEASFKCDVCQNKYHRKWQVTHHIRSTHFNLWARAPYCEMKKINQVWFEKVLNSNNFIEIKKTGHNTLIMKRIDADTTIKVTDTVRKTVDLRPIYPTSSCGKTYKNHQCKVCLKFFTKRILRKHTQEMHCKLGKFECSTCNKPFKTKSARLKHTCNELHKKNNVK